MIYYTTCSACGAYSRHEVAGEFIGTQIECDDCGTTFAVPSTGTVGTDDPMLDVLLGRLAERRRGNRVRRRLLQHSQ